MLVLDVCTESLSLRLHESHDKTTKKYTELSPHCTEEEEEEDEAGKKSVHKKTHDRKCRTFQAIILFTSFKSADE